MKTISWQVHGADKGSNQITLPQGVVFKPHLVTYWQVLKLIYRVEKGRKKIEPKYQSFNFSVG